MDEHGLDNTIYLTVTYADADIKLHFPIVQPAQYSTDKIWRMGLSLQEMLNIVGEPVD